MAKTQSLIKGINVVSNALSILNSLNMQEINSLPITAMGSQARLVHAILAIQPDDHGLDWLWDRLADRVTDNVTSYLKEVSELKKPQLKTSEKNGKPPSRSPKVSKVK